MALNLGGVIRLTYAVKNDLGVLTNPGAATITITQPDGTTASPTVTLPPAITGQLVVDYASVQSGLHSVHWATTNPITSEDDVFVAEPPKTLLVSVDEAIAHLNAAGVLTSDANREQLQWLCMVATDAVERDLNRVMVRRTVVDTFDGGTATIRLKSSPVLSITTVVENGVTLVANTDYVIDLAHELLWRGSATSTSVFLNKLQTVVVTYVAGYVNPPRAVRKTALNVVQAMWQTSQQASHPFINEEFAASLIPGAVEGLTPIEQRAYMSVKNLVGFA